MVSSHLCLPCIDRWMESLRSHPKPLTVWGHLDQYCWFQERRSRLCTFSAFSFPRPYSPYDQKTSLFSRSRAPRGYFDLLRSLHGPQSVRFDRGPRRLHAGCHGHWLRVFLITVLDFFTDLFVPIQSWFYDSCWWIQFGSIYVFKDFNISMGYGFSFKDSFYKCLIKRNIKKFRSKIFDSLCRTNLFPLI